jgi:hypothetical protein
MGDYSSNATVGGTTVGTTYLQIALAEYFYPNAIPLPTSATSKYQGKKYKLVMIVLK